MAEKNTRMYRAQFPAELYDRMQQASKIDGRTMKKFIEMACQEKVEAIELNSITRPWIPRGLKRGVR